MCCIYDGDMHHEAGDSLFAAPFMVQTYKNTFKFDFFQIAFVVQRLYFLHERVFCNILVGFQYFEWKFNEVPTQYKTKYRTVV